MQPRTKIWPFLFLAFAFLAATWSIFNGASYGAQVLIHIAINSLLAVGLRFVLLIGELNIATAAFFGIGAYATAVGVTQLHLTWWIALGGGALIVTILGACVGYVTLRIKGAYFLLITFAFTEVVRMLYTRIKYLGGNSGVTNIFPPSYLEATYPVIVIAVATALISILYALERSACGHIWHSIKTNDLIPRAAGLNVTGWKILCFVIASVAVSVGGGLQALANNVIAPSDFGFFLAVMAIIYVKVGGEESVGGAIVGATLLTVAGQWLLGFGMYETMFYGFVIIFIMLFLPRGIVGVISTYLQSYSDKASK